jgi:enamine deaminase RidA (YjgF/YER057c/UK114 family)
VRRDISPQRRASGVALGGRRLVSSLPKRGVAAYAPGRSKTIARRASMTIKRIETGTRLSQAVVHGDTVYLAGVVPDDYSLDAKGQTEQIVRKIDRLLAAAGSDKTKMLMATIWLTDMRDFADMNSVWDKWVPEGCAPARACVESRLAVPTIKVEIRIVAAL